MTPSERAAASVDEESRNADVRGSIPPNAGLSADEEDEIVRSCWNSQNIPECVRRKIDEIRRRKTIDSPGF